jgi:WD40 repeat protein
MKFQPYDSALGIKCASFSNNGELLAIGSYDEKIRLINLVSLRLVVELEHKAQITSYKDLVVYREEEYKDMHISSKLTTKCLQMTI